MKNLILIKANLKRGRGVFAGIGILMFLITVSLGAVLNILSNAKSYNEQELDRVGYGDLALWVTAAYDSGSLTDQILALEETERVETEEILFSPYRVNDTENGSDGLFMLYEPERYKVFDDNLSGYKKTPVVLKEGEALVSPSFVSLCNAGIGDTIEVKISGDSDIIGFKIAGFFEDPMGGSAIMGIKTILMTEADIEKLKEAYADAKETAVGIPGHVINIYCSPNSALSDGAYQKLLNEQTDIKQAGFMLYTKSNILGFMLLLQDIFAGVLLLFTIVLFVITMIIIGHNMKSGIEQDYVDLGILKALGYTKRKLTLIQLQQYFTVILAGMLPGIPVSVLAAKYLIRLTVTTTGMLTPIQFPAGIYLLVLFFMLLVLTGVIAAGTVKIGKVRPILAIRGGREDIYFKSRLHAPIYKRGFSFWLAFRQVVSGKKQYFNVCIAAALLVFCLSLMGRIDAWMGPEGEGLIYALDVAPNDIAIRYEEEIREETEELIEEKAGIMGQYGLSRVHGAVNGLDYQLYWISDPEYYNILDGRTCRYENEIVITEYVSNDLGVHIGDTVEVTYKESSDRFLITGIYQCANDVGANAGISAEGFWRLTGQETDNNEIHYLLKNPEAAEEIKEILSSRYEGKLTIGESGWSGISAVLVVFDALEVLMYLVTVIFIFVVVIMTEKKVLNQERQNLGIYKALGFSSRRLRGSFALRFLITAAVGAAAGILSSAYFTDPMAEAMLKTVGISRFTSSLSLIPMLIPGAVVTLLFFSFAWLSSGKIKKVAPGVLVAE